MAVQTEERELISAQARYVRSSARKARLVLEHIRGISAVEAQAILQFHTRVVAKDAGKVLKSAIANAENNFGHDPDELVVIAAYADEGPTLKRWRPRARGRVNRIEKRTCHITIKLSPALPGEIKPKRERPVRVPRQAAPAEPDAVEETTPVAEPEVEETPAAAEPEVEETAAAAEPEAAEEPEAAAPEAEQDVAEVAAEPEAEVPATEETAGPEPAADEAEEPAAEAEEPADDESPKPDEEAKS
jgi:large subunit ribosomal protein L22